jgi:hypothetical protein
LGKSLPFGHFDINREKEKANSMIDPQIFIDRMLEVENLTNALEDEEAKFLLDWGIARLKEKLSRIDNNEAAGEYTNNLLGYMRAVNRIAGNLENVRPESLAELAELRKIAAGTDQEVATKDLEAAASRLKVMTPRQALEILLQEA